LGSWPELLAPQLARGQVQMPADDLRLEQLVKQAPAAWAARRAGVRLRERLIQFPTRRSARKGGGLLPLAELGEVSVYYRRAIEHARSPTITESSRISDALIGKKRARRPRSGGAGGAGPGERLGRHMLTPKTARACHPPPAVPERSSQPPLEDA